MKLAAISMIRDEADIIVPFLRHLAALFDIVFLLDQRSSDGSGEVMRQACAAQAGWFYHYMDFAGRHQAEVNTVFMARAFDHGADAVFFIDSDEFVGVRAPAELQKAVLRCQERDAVGMFRLRACVPAAFNKWHFDPSDTLWISDSSSLWPKVIVTRSAFENVRGIRVSQGSHAVLSLDEEPLPYLDVGHLLHVPIRSRQQFVQKVFLSVISNLAKNNLMLKEGRHKRRLLEMIAGDELSDVVLASIASQYPPVDEISWWDSLDEFPSRGFSQRTLGVPFSNLGLREPPQSDFRRILARCLTEFQQERLDEEGSLEFEQEVVRFRARTVPTPEQRDTQIQDLRVMLLYERLARAEEVSRLKESTSWRVTAPLRALSGSFRQLFRRNH